MEPEFLHVVLPSVVLVVKVRDVDLVEIIPDQGQVGRHGAELLGPVAVDTVEQPVVDFLDVFFIFSLAATVNRSIKVYGLLRYQRVLHIRGNRRAWVGTYRSSVRRGFIHLGTTADHHVFPAARSFRWWLYRVLDGMEPGLLQVVLRSVFLVVEDVKGVDSVEIIAVLVLHLDGMVYHFTRRHMAERNIVVTDVHARDISKPLASNQGQVGRDGAERLGHIAVDMVEQLVVVFLRISFIFSSAATVSRRAVTVVSTFAHFVEMAMVVVVVVVLLVLL